MTTWYVHRRDDNSIASVHGEPVEGYAEEAMDDTSPEFPAWARPPKPRAACSAWQFRKEARVRGIKAEVDALIAAQDDETKEAFEYATEYWSDNPLLLALAAQLPTPLTEEQVYEMILAAARRVVGVP